MAGDPNLSFPFCKTSHHQECWTFRVVGAKMAGLWLAGAISAVGTNKDEKVQSCWFLFWKVRRGKQVENWRSIDKDLLHRWLLLSRVGPKSTSVSGEGDGGGNSGLFQTLGRVAVNRRFVPPSHLIAVCATSWLRSPPRNRETNWRQQKTYITQ